MNEVKRQRLNARLTQAEIAKKMNVDDSTVSKWETIGGSIPRVKSLLQLAAIYICTVEELLGIGKKSGGVAGFVSDKTTDGHEIIKGATYGKMADG